MNGMNGINGFEGFSILKGSFGYAPKGETL